MCSKIFVVTELRF